jgi:serine/threonine-protein kinase
MERPPAQNAMEPDRELDWDHVDRLLAAALEQPPAARAGFLDEACAPDEALRAMLGRLVSAAETEDAFLETPAVAAAAVLVADWAEGQGDERPPPEDRRDGRRVGAYRLLDKLGEGGMGTVYRAERADGQFEHRVALKLVRTGLESEEVRRWFRRERQILARLSHPHIARLLGGGVLEGPGGEEQPYLVMELVEGEPLTAYCDRRRLPTEARLALFAQACEAVRYAHGHLVIHRDLKPSNILVTEDDLGAPQVKLLDFGIARLLDEHDEAAGAATRTLVPRLTPEYAAPEQVRGEPVTTATDVYALGVLLYELLTGHRPYTFARRTPGEVERVVCEQTPERPSAVVTRAPEADGPERAAEPDALRRRLRGALDTVVLKALAKEPATRYATADALLEDVRRHLAGLPVSAHVPSAAYRARLFVRRHRWGVAAAAAFAFLVVAGTALYTAGIARERNLVRQEADKAARVTEFLLSLFEANDPAVARGDTLTAGALMERGLHEADALRHQPEVQARLLEVIGRTYRSMGRPDLAEAPLAEALALQRRLHPEPHPDLARSLFWAAAVFGDRDDYGDAEALYREGLAMQRGLLGANDPALGATLYELAGVLHFQGRQAEADTLFQEALRIFRRLPDTSDPETMRALVDMARYLYYSQSIDDAETLYRRVLQMQEAYYGDVHPAPAATRLELARVLSSTHRYRDSEQMSREGLGVAAPRLGEHHSVVQGGRRDLAMTLYQLGRYAEAEQLLRQALDAGPDQSSIMRAGILLDLGFVLMEQGRLDEAEPLVRENIRIQEEGLGAGSVYVGEGLVALGRLERLRKNYGAATAHLTRARAIYVASLRADHPWQAKVLREFAHVKVETGAFAEAEPLLRQTLAIQGRNPFVNPYQHAEAQRLMGVTLTHLGRYEEAEIRLRASLRTAEEGERPDLAEQARQTLLDLSVARRRPLR